MTAAALTPDAELVAAFRRLFDNEFLTLDGVTISYRTPRDIRYLDQDNALDALLFGSEAPTMPAVADTETQALHLALFAAAPDAECVVSGWSRHLRALLLEGFGPPPPTSMMKKRGIPDVAAHLVESDALSEPKLAASIERARTLAEQNGMRHLLLLTTEGVVAIAGEPFNEAVSHWHNIEFASRVECLSIEEARVHRARQGRPDG
jgi:ribulose-5-phosphate 4-epimerase/fuculose-1-phosphate aldolase